MSKERLEDIKERFVKYQTDYNLNGEEVEWLIQQTELMQHFAKKNGELNMFLSKHIEPKHLGKNVINIAMDIITKQAERVQELEEKVKQYEKALAGFNKEFNFEYRWQKSNVKRNPKSQWQRGALEGFEHVKRIYDKHVEVQND